MGKKNAESKSQNIKLSHQARTELTQITSEIFQTCIGDDSGLNPLQQWEEFLEIQKMVEKARVLEKDIKLPTYNRAEHFDPFRQWLQKKGVKINGLDIHSYDDLGYGLKCTKELTKGDEVIVIPKSVVMSEDTAKRSCLGPLIEKNPVLSNMGNIGLALHLLNEFLSKNSEWQPYLRILPSTYSTVLYFTPEQVQNLKGSPVFEDTLRQYRNIARQYAYFYRIFQTSVDAKSWPIRDYFTYDSYRWAVSCVMTRINHLPSNDGCVRYALIPAWDMSNHEYGAISTVFNDKNDTLLCYAHRNFSVNEQFHIYYGKRTNSEFFLHNGLVYKDNPDDMLKLKLGVSKSDPHYNLKSEVLSSMKLPMRGSFLITMEEEPITPALMTFVRILCLHDKAMLEWVEKKHKGEELDADQLLTETIEGHAWKFLLARLNLLIQTYGSTSEADEMMSGPVGLVRALFIEEKKILEHAIKFVQTKISPS